MTSRLAVPPDLRGRQRPRLSLTPPYVSSTGTEAVRLAAMAGLYLDPWQALVLKHSLGEREDGKWSAFEVGLVVARQNGKNALLEARELAELFLIPEQAGPRTIVHSAHLFATSLEHFRRLAERIKSTPELARKVKRRGSKLVGIRESHGEESIELGDGSRILFAARTRGGRRGFTIDLLVWDEAMELPDAVIGAVMPTVSAKTGREFLPGPQVWYTGSAVNQDTMPHGLQLTRVRERGLSGEDDALAYFEWSAPEDADPASPATWALANPGLGIRITSEYVALERQAMPAVEFAVERLGIGDWPDTSEESGRVIPREQWNELAETDQANRIVCSRAYAIDTNTDQTWGSIAVAGQRGDGLWQCAVIEHARGKDWIVGRCAELHAQDPEARFVVDPRGPAANLIGDLRDAGIEPVETSTQDYGSACADFLGVALEARLRYPAPQLDLDHALSNARTQPLGDRWKWSRKSSTSADISPLVAVTLALWGAMNAEAEYATVLFASDQEPDASEQQLVGAQAPRVLTQEETTICFACSQGHCPVHNSN